MRLGIGIQSNISALLFSFMKEKKKEIEKKENAKNNYKKYRKGVTTTMGPELAY